MHRHFPRTVSCLALMLGSGILSAQGAALPLPRTQLRQATALQPQRADLALSHLLGQRASLGLGAQEGFVVEHAASNPRGETVVSLAHTYQGFKVWGSRAAAKVSAQGAVVQTSTRGVMQGVALTGLPGLSSAQAAQIAVAKLGADVRLQGAPDAQQVVFSPRYMRETFRPLERFGQPKAYIWAYQVHVGGTSPRGPVSMTYIIDGDTGVVLREDNQIAHAAAQPVPAYGTALGFYSGQFTVPTTRMEDNSYALWDTTRGSRPNPQLYANYTDPYNPWGVGTVWNPAGLQVWFGAKDAGGFDTGYLYLFQKDALTGDFNNAWGDGLPWGGDWVHEGLANGQTAAADIMHAMAVTWDMMGNVFNFNGIDGAGTTPYAIALQGGPQDTGGYQTDVASWDYYNFKLNLGAGSNNDGNHPGGLSALNDIDVVTHELAHGFSLATANFDSYPPTNVVEEPALEEGTADFLAQMAKAYALVGPGDDPWSLPNAADWTFGARVNHGTPLRWLDKPSKDGLSYDEWHDGVSYIDPHYTGGVLTRALSFLASGAASDPASDTYSRHLPAGMAGVGLDHAARIWMKVMTENFVGHPVSSLQFKDARSAALGAAIDLFGEGSAEAVGVENAFAAVNVGAAHGQPARVEVAFKDWRAEDDWFKVYWYPWFASRQVFPIGETVPLKITVSNTANTSVTWSVGGPSLYKGVTPASGTQAGGRINADGTWTIPNVEGKYALTATSVADPSQYAEGRAICVHFDCDSDGENDAMDMAAIGLEWMVSDYLDFNQTVFPGLGADDSTVAFMVDCIKNAWPVK